MSGDLDKAIDRAVRDMLDIEPRAGFQARVMRRVANPDRHLASDEQVASGFSRKILWLGVPAALAASLTLALLLPSRSTERTQPAPATARVEVPPTAAIAPTVTPPAAEPGSAARSRAVDRPRTAQSRPVRSAAAPAPDRMVAAAAIAPENGVEIEPLDAVDPIQPPAIGTGTIAHREVVVAPLRQVAQLQIAPLSAPDGRN